MTLKLSPFQKQSSPYSININSNKKTLLLRNIWTSTLKQITTFWLILKASRWLKCQNMKANLKKKIMINYWSFWKRDSEKILTVIWVNSGGIEEHMELRNSEKNTLTTILKLYKKVMNTWKNGNTKLRPTLRLSTNSTNNKSWKFLAITIYQTESLKNPLLLKWLFPFKRPSTSFKFWLNLLEPKDPKDMRFWKIKTRTWLKTLT